MQRNRKSEGKKKKKKTAVQWTAQGETLWRGDRCCCTHGNSCWFWDFFYFIFASLKTGIKAWIQHTRSPALILESEDEGESGEEEEEEVAYQEGIDPSDHLEAASIYVQYILNQNQNLYMDSIYICTFGLYLGRECFMVLFKVSDDILKHCGYQAISYILIYCVRCEPLIPTSLDIFE